MWPQRVCGAAPVHFSPPVCTAVSLPVWNLKVPFSKVHPRPFKADLVTLPPSQVSPLGQGCRSLPRPVMSSSSVVSFLGVSRRLPETRCCLRTMCRGGGGTAFTRRHHPPSSFLFGSPEHEHQRLAYGQVSLLHVHGLPDHFVPTHLVAPTVAFSRYLSAQRAPGFRRVRLRLTWAGSSVPHGRIGFVILRTGHSPPVASGPISR